MKAMGYAQRVLTKLSLSGNTLSATAKNNGNDETDTVDLSGLSVAYASSAGNADTVDNIHGTELAKKTDLLNAIYPVGSIYISTNNNSPQNFLGGTWVRIEGRFLLGAGSGYGAGSTGGEATHTLTTGEMPGHSHTVRVYSGVTSGGYSYVAKAGSNYVTSTSTSVTASGASYSVGNIGTGENGLGQAHNNMPPYLAVYIWKRTA